MRKITKSICSGCGEQTEQLFDCNPREDEQGNIDRFLCVDCMHDELIWRRRVNLEAEREQEKLEKRRQELAMRFCNVNFLEHGCKR